MKKTLGEKRLSPTAPRSGAFARVRSGADSSSLPKATHHRSRNVQRVEVHIDELVLHGFPPSDGRPIADAFQSELIRLISREGFPPSSARALDIDHAIWGPLRISQGDCGGSTGAALARVILEGLSR